MMSCVGKENTGVIGALNTGVTTVNVANHLNVCNESYK